MLKFIKRLILAILIIAILIVGFISFLGYQMYKTAITESSLQDKITIIQEQEDYIKLEDIPEIYKNAVIAVEDHRFKKHNGIDLISTTRAIISNISEGELGQGGSTITQQLAKNLYFTQEKKFTRKVAELFVAFDLEKAYSKDDILELYINTIYYGKGYYGLVEACDGFYEKYPSEMTDYESTFLAGIPNAPSIYSSEKNIELARQRQKQVLDAMVKRGYLSQEEADEIYSLASSFNLLSTLSLINAYTTDANGTLIAIPGIPHIAPPTVTATRTHIPGNPTELPTTFGYITFPSICCNIIINIKNPTANIGFCTAINKNPIAAPINAPNIGINAVNPINTDIVNA